MDSGYGSDPGLLYALDGDGEILIAEVHCMLKLIRIC
jgi:hypothetical protein